MAKERDRSATKRAPRRPLRAGSRRLIGLAGKPLQIGRRRESLAHAVRQKPPLRERLAARVKQQTKLLEPVPEVKSGGRLRALARHARESILPNDPRDAERREQSGEPVVAFVGAVDLVLLLAVVVLLVVGTVMVYSASLAYAYTMTDSTSYYLVRQGEWMALGLVGGYLAMRIDYRRWRILAGPGIVVTAALLLLLHTHFGVHANGATRWLAVGSFLSVEPSELAKMGLVLYAAHWFAGQRAELRHSLRGLIPFGCVIGAVVALVFKEPDLGTTAVIVAALLMVYFVAGARLWHLGAMAALGVVGYRLYLPHMPAYQQVRLEAFLNPTKWLLSANNHYTNVKYALGMGGVSGVGLGNSQEKFIIFQPHTDSIFAILGEEWGVIGTIGVLCVFLLFAVRGLRASMLAPDLFGRLLAVGLTGSIVVQALLNMAVVAGVVPFTGIPLPFISYGGSSLSISMVAAGILLNVSKYAIDPKEERDPASTYLWWRYRRTPLPGPGRGGAPNPRPALGHPRAALSGQSRAVGARRAVGR